ncbi:type I-E CRISPR-associated protein Cas7/Cse4/CasC [Lactobacillus hamsteri]|uniref:Crispr-associated protein n=1 Tax=Lactobacillus hamsteri DSM 5661 = JCM 6256 TaxID=1423754 RepID=A0A0R1YE57_9LACO|nr:type I-E CRISPR-associated protein Cas7/Cse4/CasC [Lactobacillus hamsteri]KRM38171.1 crispr-associated protein [Lactobacillus hamsteri DSM 5661 = JCM 6256]
MKKNLYVDINVLQTVPSSNINRDDTGSPKTAVYGGVTRSRVSSQSWKRAVRLAFKSEDEEWLDSYRTKKVVYLLADELKKLDDILDDDAAIDKAQSILKAVGIKATKDKKTGEILTGALLLVSRGEIEKIAKYATENDVTDKEAKKAIKDLLMSDQSLDLALFGRMVADNPELNVDASCQVAHSISTHEIIPEFDYYTAVDDNRSEDNAGSAMIGTIEYNSSTLYRYANINLNELEHNLGKDLTLKGMELFIKDFILTMPTGKENTFANKTLPQYVLVNVREDTPVNLVSAFENPVNTENGYVDTSIKRLEKENADAEGFVDEPVLSIVLTNKDTDISNKAENIKDMLSKISEVVSQRLADEDNNN